MSPFFGMVFGGLAVLGRFFGFCVESRSIFFFFSRFFLIWVLRARWNRV